MSFKQSLDHLILSNSTSLNLFKSNTKHVVSLAVDQQNVDSNVSLIM